MPLLKALGDENQQVRQYAVSALGLVAEAEHALAGRILDALLASLRKKSDAPSVADRTFVTVWYNFADARITSKALERVARANPKLTLESFQALRYDESYGVNSPVIPALGQIALADPSLADDVLNELIMMSYNVKEYAGSLPEALERVAQAAPKRALEPLLGMLDGDDPVRIAALPALGRVARADLSLADKVVGRLLPALEDDNAVVRSTTAKALGQIAYARPDLVSEVSEPLLRALKDKSADVRRAAAGALGEIAEVDDKTREIAFRLLTDYDSDVRAEVRPHFVEILLAQAEKEQSPGKFLLEHLEGRQLLLGTGDVHEHAVYRHVVIGALTQLLTPDKPKTVGLNDAIRRRLEELRDSDERLHLRIAAWKMLVGAAERSEEQESGREED